MFVSLLALEYYGLAFKTAYASMRTAVKQVLLESIICILAFSRHDGAGVDG